MLGPSDPTTPTRRSTHRPARCGWTVLLSVDHHEGAFRPQEPSVLYPDRGEPSAPLIEVRAGSGAVKIFDVLSQRSDHAYKAQYAQTGSLRLDGSSSTRRPTVTVTVLQ